MAVSYNGWQASQSPGAIGVISIEPVPGRKFNVAREAAPLFNYLIVRFHNEVEAIDQGIFDDWSYAYRANRNSNNLSCHSSGTAVDLNATKHPNGKRNTFTSAQRARINEILRDLEGTITWGDPGGPYGWKSGSTPDEMHFEVSNRNMSKINSVIAKIGGKIPSAGGGASGGATSPLGNSTAGGGIVDAVAKSGLTVLILQAALNNHGYGLSVDGKWGPKTLAAVKAFQSARGLTVDGWVGWNTWTSMQTPATTPAVPAYPLSGSYIFGTYNEKGLAKYTKSNSGKYKDASIAPHIKKIQERLNLHAPYMGAGKIAVDGSFGPATRALVVAFQRARGLTVDGTVGPKTWTSLFV